MCLLGKEFKKPRSALRCQRPNNGSGTLCGTLVIGGYDQFTKAMAYWCPACGPVKLGEIDNVKICPNCKRNLTPHTKRALQCAPCDQPYSQS